MGKEPYEGFKWPDFTMVPNDVFRRFIGELSGSGFKVLLALIHQCMYVNRDEDGQPEFMAPLSQGDLQEITDMSRKTVKKGLRECLESGAVLKLEPYDPETQMPALYGLKLRGESTDLPPG